MMKMTLVDVATSRALHGWENVSTPVVPRHAEHVVEKAMSGDRLVERWVVARVEWKLGDFPHAFVYLVPEGGGG